MSWYVQYLHILIFSIYTHYMREADAVMATLILGRLQTLEANPDIGGTEAWTIKQTAADIRRAVGSALFSHVDELAPSLSPQKGMRMSLKEYQDSLLALKQSASVDPQIPEEPVIQQSDDSDEEVRFDSEAVTAEIPVRRRNWSEFMWDMQRKWKRLWKLWRKG